MSAQSSMQALTNTVIRGVGALGGAANSIKLLNKVNNNFDVKDIQMAQRARQKVQGKINAIYANKEISNKAKTRRIGKVLDEYKGGE